MEFKMPLQDFGLGSLMNLSELNIDDFNNDSLRRILNKGLDTLEVFLEENWNYLN